jgi:hypothetical protein
MCTAVLSVSPGLPVLLAGVRDEFTDRAWAPPGRHWPSLPGLLGGRDLQAGGTWLAVAPDGRRAACVLNGIGQLARAGQRQSRGTLPLRAAAGEPLDRDELARLDPFRLLTVEPGRAVIQSWNGAEFIERDLPPGLHMVVNSDLASDLLAAQPTSAARHNTLAASHSAPAASDSTPAASDSTPASTPARQRAAAEGRAHERARISHFLPLFEAARRPIPAGGVPAAEAWGDWLPLVNGGGLDAHDPRALIVRRRFADGRTWGTTSISLVALGPDLVRYDFTGRPGDPGAWARVL